MLNNGLNVSRENYAFSPKFVLTLNMKIYVFALFQKFIHVSYQKIIQCAHSRFFIPLIANILMQKNDP